MQIEATVNYHVRKSVPQAFEFDVGGQIGTLVSPELETTAVSVTDVRADAEQPEFANDGIVFVEPESRVPEVESGTAWQADYDRELADLLSERIGAEEVIVFDHTVRTDDPDATRRPARNVHNDYNRAGAEQRLVDIVGEERAEQYRQGRYGFVNVWRPVGQVIRSSPLGFIRPDTVAPTDWMDIDLIYPDRVGQILGVAANPGHRWFYKSEMAPGEAVIFNIYDNRGRPHLAHSALDLPGDAAVAVPRKSLESRTLVRYA